MRAPRSTDRRPIALILLALSGCATHAASSGARPESAGAHAARAGDRVEVDVTLASLLDALADLDTLTRLPSPAYESLFSSSFDRSSATAQPGEGAFFANRDFAVWEGRAEQVLLDAAGPGVVTRLWSANPSGTLRVYVDDQAQPVLSASMRSLLGGDQASFTSPFSFVVAGGHNSYFPIPFQKRCRITVAIDEAGEHRLYYQVDHRRYAAGVRVQPLSPTALEQAEEARSRAEQRLRDPMAAKVSGEQRELQLTVAPGRAFATTLRAADGGVLRELQLSLITLDAATLREIKLEVFVDGENTVRVPLGDFFGASPEPRAVTALPIALDPRTRTLTARWPMPFSETLRIVLTSTSERSLSGTLRLTSAAREHGSDTLLFHAQWQPPSWRKSEPTHDWTLTEISGTGLYVGNLLHVINTNASWWGEGDEKVYVDGETFPSRFGTGTEDYYGYAYCSNELFSTALVGQPSAGERKSFGAISLYRFHMLDAIAFQSSLRFDFEVNHWGDTPIDMAYDGTVFFYAKKGARAEPTAEDDTTYRIPAIPVEAPTDVPAGPYVCGGS